MTTRAKQPRPQPVPSVTTKFFWDAAKDGKLAVQYDPVAKQYQFWPRAISVVTGQQISNGASSRGWAGSIPTP